MSRNPRRRRTRRWPLRTMVAVPLVIGVSAIAWANLHPRSHPEPRRSARAAHPQAIEPMGYQWQPMGVADPMTHLPEYASPPQVEPLYRFALAHPEILTYVPCTCGCGAEGHRSNWNCYIRGVTAQGKVVFDEMAPT